MFLRGETALRGCKSCFVQTTVSLMSELMGCQCWLGDGYDKSQGSMCEELFDILWHSVYVPDCLVKLSVVVDCCAI